MPQLAASRPPGEEPLRLRAPEAAERGRLLAWLDDGLRDGRRGRLEAEYPVSLRAEQLSAHRAVFAAGQPRAHAMYHALSVRAAGRALRLGLIGLVYTEPAWRRRGLAARCVEACVEALARDGAALALLWSDRHEFYARLGFQPAGREWRVRFDAGLARRARGSGSGGRVGRPEPSDWPVLQMLRATRVAHAEQPPGALAALAAAPQTELRVARRGGRVRGWAALGRGDDFAGVVHDWAGSPDAVLACLEALAAAAGPLWLLAGSLDEAPVRRLKRAGAEAQAGCFTLARLLAPEACYRTLVPDSPRGLALEGPARCPRLRHASAVLELEPQEALALLFAELPVRLRERLAGGERTALARRLPWPLYLGGFDSV